MSKTFLQSRSRDCEIGLLSHMLTRGVFLCVSWLSHCYDVNQRYSVALNIRRVFAGCISSHYIVGNINMKYSSEKHGKYYICLPGLSVMRFLFVLILQHPVSHQCDSAVTRAILTPEAARELVREAGSLPPVLNLFLMKFKRTRLPKVDSVASPIIFARTLCISVPLDSTRSDSCDVEVQPALNHFHFNLQIRNIGSKQKIFICCQKWI